ncbi:hypothetical protein PR048_000720 [Dryococelus australis]|uniref:Uncharacterized protein n=1 Tax=Dryococelus australis TaxID=614101 RepID=A0ABQ9IHS4_9NEOP|nr:hypothetical protein PR048_000720 [Dryococelus australis]
MLSQSQGLNNMEHHKLDSGRAHKVEHYNAVQIVRTAPCCFRSYQNSDLNLIDKIVKLLKPFYAATENISNEQKLISEAIPIINGLIQDLNKPSEKYSCHVNPVKT